MIQYQFRTKTPLLWVLILLFLVVPLSAQQQTAFDIVWSAQNQTLPNYFFKGAGPLTAGSEIIFSAQPQAKTDPSQYEFNWFVNGQKQAEFSGVGKNYLVLQTLSQPTIYEVVCQIKEGGKIVQSKTFNLLTQEPELLTYAGLPEGRTQFLFKKVVNGTIRIQEELELLLKTFIFGASQNASTAFSWQLDNNQTESSPDNAFVLKIPPLEEEAEKESKTLRLQSLLNGATFLNKNFNLFWK